MALRVDPARTKDSASLLRPPETQNLKLSTPREVTLAKATWERLDTGDTLRRIREARARYCPAPAIAEGRNPVERAGRKYGPPNMNRLRAALANLDPDCSEEEWKLHRIAPLALAAREYPEFAEPLRNLTIEWSSGALRGTPSRKWSEPGGNGLTGEQIFPEVWDRFVHEPAREGPVFTLGTIFKAAQLVGGLPDVLPAEPLGYLQQRYALILQGGDLYGVRLIDGDPRQLFIKERALRRLMRRDLKKRFPGHDPGPIVDEFFDCSRTTFFKGVYCHPTEERSDWLNLWRGPTLEPKPGDCKLILAFLWDVICDGGEVLYDYLLNYLAHMLQRPEEKPGVIIILIGGQGTGKGTFGYLLRQIFGDSYLHVGRIETVLGNFNGALERSLVVFLDEAFFHGDRRHTEALKSLGTEPTIVINEKHQPSRQVESFHRFVIATNAEHVKHTDADDRRDFVLRVSDRCQGDMEYWKPLYAEINGEGAAALMLELLQRDISEFNVRQRPVTAALIDQRLQSLDDVGRWWYQCLQDGGIQSRDLHFRASTEDGWPPFLATEDLRGMVEEYAGSRRHGRLTTQIVVRELLQLCPSINKAQKAPTPGAARRRGLELPPMEVARKEFEAYIGHEVDWDD